MKSFQNLTIIGTSHIARQSIQEVTTAIREIKPEIIALELDPNRFQALLQKKKRKIGLSELSRVGLKGFLFAWLGSYLQKKLGKIVKVEPGSEMLTAINLAKENKIKLALVDQPIEVTLRRFSQEFTGKEKFRFLADFFRGIFFRKRELKKYQLEEFDLTKVPEEKLIKKMIKQVKQRYPSLYKVLVEERNQVIAKNLGRLLRQNPKAKIIAVVGAGHEVEIINLIVCGKLVRTPPGGIDTDNLP